MPEPESKEDPVVKIAFHYKSGECLVIPIRDDRCVQGFKPEVVEQYNRFSKKVEDLHKEASELVKVIIHVEYKIPIDMRGKSIDLYKIVSE